MIDLSSSMTKLERAEEHFKTLRAEIAAFGERQPYRVVRQSNADHTEHTLQLTFNERPPLQRWGAILGDGVQALRSALDHAVYAVAVFESDQVEPPDANVLMFPIAESPSQFPNWRVKSLSEPVRAFIKREQPDPDRLDDSVLWRLEEINRSDKHRVIHIGGVLPAVAQVPISGLIPGTKCTVSTRVDRLEDGAPFLTLTCERPSPDVQMDVDITLFVGVERVSKGRGNKQFTPVENVIDVLHGAVLSVIERLAASAEASSTSMG